MQQGPLQCHLLSKRKTSCHLPKKWYRLHKTELETLSRLESKAWTISLESTFKNTKMSLSWWMKTKKTMKKKIKTRWEVHTEETNQRKMIYCMESSIIRLTSKSCSSMCLGSLLVLVLEKLRKRQLLILTTLYQVSLMITSERARVLTINQPLWIRLAAKIKDSTIKEGS